MGLTIGPTGKLMTLNGKLFIDDNGMDCCCGGGQCCCPGPACVHLLFELVSGPPCPSVCENPSIDGYEYEMDASPPEPGQECYTTYHGDVALLGCGSIEMELSCTEENVYDLSTVTESPYIHYPGENENSRGQLVSGQCNPFELVYLFEVRNGAATICENETTEPQIVRVTVTEC